MTNEELAIRAKAGDKSGITELFQQLEKWFYKVSNSFFRRCSERCACSGTTVDDLFQSCYFAMLKAVKAYNPESGYKFVTYLRYHIKNELNGLVGLKTEAQRNTPLNSCTSLDGEIQGADDVILSDSIPDENAERDFEEAERRIFNDKLRADLDKALSMIPGSCERVIRGRYYRNKTLAELAAELGITLEAVRQRAGKGMRLLRSGERLCVLRQYQDEVIDRYAYNGGLSRFKAFGISSTEFTVEQLERLAEDFGGPKKPPLIFEHPPKKRPKVTNSHT